MNFSSKPGLLEKSRDSQLGRVLPPEGIFSNVWRHFLFSCLAGGGGKMICREQGKEYGRPMLIFLAIIILQ